MSAPLFPLFADLRNRPVRVVGGGIVAERKVEALLRAGALPRVGALVLSPRLQHWHEEGRVEWQPGEFREDWLDGVWL
ncbi:MAG TPA: NAD(P)-dependent oxidoreductase, partial [Pseudoxanthomonas sp.]|nr:NAD(P)-dependent oxidoreductase [Pseudoxanthomonas sp.]